MDAQLREDALRTLSATPALIEAIVDLAPPALLVAQGDDAGDWNVNDVVAHLLVVERRGAIDRIKSIVAEDEPALQNRDEQADLIGSGLRGASARDTAIVFAAERADDVHFLYRLDDAAWARAGVHSVAGRVTAAEFLAHAAYHDTLHIAQMLALIDQRFEPHRGPMRQF